MVTQVKDRVNGNGDVAEAIAAPASGKKRGADKTISVTPLEIAHLQVPLVGTTTLIMNSFSHKAMQQMLDKQTGKVAGGPRAKKDVRADFLGAFNVVRGREKDHKGEESPQGAYGIAGSAIRGSMIDACRLAGVQMTIARIAFRIDEDFVPLVWDKIEMRQDHVRLESGVADIRHRPEFFGWACALTIKYDARAITATHLVTLLDRAGFGVGLGEWRPFSKNSHGGSHGTFRPGTKEEWDDIQARLKGGQKGSRK